MCLSFWDCTESWYRHHVIPKNPYLILLRLGRRRYDDIVPVRRPKVKLLKDFPPGLSFAKLRRPRHLCRDEPPRGECGVVHRVLTRLGWGHHSHGFGAEKHYTYPFWNKLLSGNMFTLLQPPVNVILKYFSGC